MAEGGREASGERRQMEDGGISNTVAVSGFSTNTTQELLEMYFENSRRSGGGDMEEVHIRDSVAYITFKDSEVAQRVVSYNHHQVEGQTLSVKLFHPLPPKPCYQNRVLVQGLNSAVTEELLTNFLETVTEAEVREFLYGEEEGNVVVTLSDNIDIVQLKKTCQIRSIEGAFLNVARVDISNCILVQNMQPSTSHDVVLYYFDNKRRSGGGDVERVEMKADEGYCLVYFENPSVIDRVLSQSHKVHGADVEVHLHHECLGQRSSRIKSNSNLKISSPEKKDSVTLEGENTDNQSKDETSSDVSSNPDKDSDFAEVREWQENDGKNCTLTLWIKYKRPKEMTIMKDMKKISCSWNFHIYWYFYTKTNKGKQMLDEIVNKYNCSVAVCSDDEDVFIFEISEKSFEQEPDVVHFIHDVLDNVHKCAQQFLYFDVLVVDKRMQGDVLQVVRQRKELDGARIELMGQHDHDAVCVVCTEKEKISVLHDVTEIINNVKECFENHEEIISVDCMWIKVMKSFGYLQKLKYKYPSVTILPDETKSAIMLKGPWDLSKAAADHLLELLEAAHTEVQEDIFSPGCQFEIFTCQEMCNYIDSIIMELATIWLPNHLTKKLHLFSKMSEKIKGINKFIKGCIQERRYPLPKGQTAFSTEMFRSLDELKNKYKGKIVINSSHKGLLVTTADDIFESVDDAVVELIDKEKEQQLIMITDVTTQLPVFKEPLRLIDTRRDGRLGVMEDVLNQISQIPEPLNVVAITGQCRTGRSYLLNHLAGVNKEQQLIITDVTTQLPVFKEPLILIDTGEDGRLIVMEDVLNQISQIPGPLNIVAVTGQYRTGKSYLLNRLAGVNKGFPLGTTIKSKTKGIWAWCRPHPIRSNEVLLLLDTEGSGDVEKGDRNHDNLIFALATLLSSTLVYNCFGRFDLSKLNFLEVISEYIRISDSLVSEESTRDFDFPLFILTLRDFCQELKSIDGKAVTSDEYMEHCLRSFNAKWNKIIMNIKKHFRKRKCFTFTVPGGRGVLKDLESLTDADLDDEFINDSKCFNTFVLCECPPKELNGQAVNGRMFASLTRTYVETIRKGKILCIENALEAMAEIENTSAVEASVALYMEKIQTMVQVPVPDNYVLTDAHHICMTEAIALFLKKAVYDHDQIYQKQANVKMNAEYENLKRRNEQSSETKSQEALAQLNRTIEDKIKQGVYICAGGYSLYQQDITKIKEEYKKLTGLGCKKQETLAKYLESKVVEGQTIFQADQILSQKQKRI